MSKNKYIATPQTMWDLFVEYKIDVKGNPRLKRVFVGKDGTKESEELERPLTMAGFDIFVMNNEGVASRGVEQYFGNQDDLYDAYIGICTRIRKEIKDDQITGGMVGQYNASITQRLNGLTDKQEVKQETTYKTLDINIIETGVPLASNEKDIVE